MATTQKKSKKPSRGLGRTLDARPDTIDFRDRMFVPTLCEVPEEMTLKAYEQRLGGKALILDQGEEGACSGFGLAATCNYLLRARKVYSSKTPVSPRMLYEMARRYDEWRGENYEGSSARGAMKGWHKHGVCSAKLWPYDFKKRDSVMTDARARDAALRPLGAYFRVNHKDIVAMHTALSEVGILYVTAIVHQGWGKVKADGRVPFSSQVEGAHAFAIVGYDRNGFWFQNSWAEDWGHRGFGHLSYSDWLDHGLDCWVARLGAPVTIDEAQSTGAKAGGLTTSRLSFPDLRPHIVSIGNDGGLRDTGTYGNTAEDLQRMLLEDFPKLTANWKKRRVLLYAHGGLVPEDNAIQRVENYLPALLAAEVYPIAFVWKTDFWTTLKNLLNDALAHRRPEGALDAAKDFMLDRLDDTLEPIARLAGGRQIWGEMKQNAALASMHADGGARRVAEHLRTLTGRFTNIELHIAAHSAGGIFMGPLTQLLCTQGAVPVTSLKDETGFEWAPIAGLNLSIKTCTLWAAACTTGLFDATYLPAIKTGAIKNFALFNLKDATECDDDCAHIYNKSLLYLVSNAFEKKLRLMLQKYGWPILGMDRFVERHAELQRLIRNKTIDYVLAPNENPDGTVNASKAQHHGDFDDDGPTVRATLARILGKSSTTAEFRFAASAAAMRARRKVINGAGQ